MFTQGMALGKREDLPACCLPFSSLLYADLSLSLGGVLFSSVLLMVYGWSSPNAIASVAIVNSKYLTMNNFYVTWEVLENSMLPEVFLTWKLTTFEILFPLFL